MLNQESNKYFARVDIGEDGTPTAMAEAQLYNGRSKENELRSTRSHHFVCREKSVFRFLFSSNTKLFSLPLSLSLLGCEYWNGSGSTLHYLRRREDGEKRENRGLTASIAQLHEPSSLKEVYRSITYLFRNSGNCLSLFIDFFPPTLRVLSIPFPTN